MIGFENPFYLITLVFLIPLIIFIHFFSLKNTKRKTLKFANFEAMEKVTGDQILSKNFVMLYLRIFIVVLFILALSGVKIIYTGSITDRAHIIAIDSSASMKADDLMPNRFEVAKSTAIKFVDDLPKGSEVGVISFAGSSFIEQPITNDKAKIKEAINNINLRELGGTNLFDAIITSANLLKAPNTKGAIILLTDGQFNIKVLEDILVYVDEIPVYTLGIGTKQGGIFEGNTTSYLEDKTLKELANYSGGDYFNINSTEDLDRAYSKILNIKVSKKTINLSTWLLIISLCAFLIDWFLLNTRYKSLP